MNRIKELLGGMLLTLAFCAPAHAINTQWGSCVDALGLHNVSTMAANTTYNVESQWAKGVTYAPASYGNDTWTYTVSGDLQITDTSGSNQTLTVYGEAGPGCSCTNNNDGTCTAPFIHCSQSILYDETLPANQTVIVPTNLSRTGNTYSWEAFFVTAESTGSATCNRMYWLSLAHDTTNPND